MDADSQKELQRILTLHESELTETDIQFLVARRSYLTKTQRRDYADFLPQEDDVEQQEQTSTPKVNPFKTNGTTTTQYQDKDVRLNLDNAAAPIVAPVQQEPVAPVEEIQPEVAAPVVEQTPEPQVEVQTEQTVNQEKQVECLDPDCTHENHQ